MKEISFGDIKNWSPEVEKKITDQWKDSELFKFDYKTKKKIYSIDTPPPYVNAPIHIGQAVTYCYMDFFARYRRMKGYEVIFPLGLDRNGLPIEIAAEKKFSISPFNVGRERFIEACEKLLRETSAESIDTFSKLGISFTSYKQSNNIGSVYLTDSPEYRKVTQATFIDLYKKGLVYEDTRINNWDPKLQTTIADSEIDYNEVPSLFSDIIWKVKETGEKIVIGTTRPELICACGMVIFNPEDKRYKKLEGKTAISPLFNKDIKIKAHPLAQIDKGTGLVMMCSAGDLSDIQFFREQGLDFVIAINKDGTMNENSGFLKGLKIKEARNKILEELKEKGLLLKQVQIMHRTPISQRSGAEIEFIEMSEFYLKQIEFKDKIKKIIDRINFYPAESKRLLLDWINSVSIDWPISRRRYYATPIPLWYCDDMVALPPEGRYYIPWKENPPEDSNVFKNGRLVGTIKDFRNRKWNGEERVFDTWMDSSISELFIIKYKSDADFFKKVYPCSLRPQGKDIIRTWLYYSVLRAYLETKNIAFKDIWINQHIVDEKGRKMSKSLGNIVDPQSLLKEFGAEAVRIWSSIEGDLSKQDMPCSKEKIRAELKTINKIINVARFVFLFENCRKPKKLEVLDKLFIDYIEDLTCEVDKSYSYYDFNHPMLKLRRFLWELFASHYIELVKARAYNQEGKFSDIESQSARYTLHFLLERFLLLTYPVIPQLTTLIAKEKGLNLLTSEFPKFKKADSNLNLIEEIMEFNRLIWKTKKEKSMSLKDSISGIKIPESLKAFEKDITVTHNLV
jgi:valyl-tRNA synthetase